MTSNEEPNPIVVATSSVNQLLDLTDEETRLLTFRHWPYEDEVPSVILAENGFYAVASLGGFSIRCFSCGLRFDNPVTLQEIYLYHSQRSNPSCQFLQDLQDDIFFEIDRENHNYDYNGSSGGVDGDHDYVRRSSENADDAARFWRSLPSSDEAGGGAHSHARPPGRHAHRDHHHHHQQHRRHQNHVVRRYNSSRRGGSRTTDDGGSSGGGSSGSGGSDAATDVTMESAEELPSVMERQASPVAPTSVPLSLNSGGNDSSSGNGSSSSSNSNSNSNSYGNNIDDVPRQERSSDVTGTGDERFFGYDVAGNGIGLPSTTPRPRRIAERRNGIVSTTNEVIVFLAGDGGSQREPSRSNVCIKPAWPSYARYDDRLNTYSDWPVSIPVTKNALSEAGFFYMNRNDTVHCFHCGVMNKQWEAGDDPWIEHGAVLVRPYKPYRNNSLQLDCCFYVYMNRGLDFVETAREKKKRMIVEANDAEAAAVSKLGSARPGAHHDNDDDNADDETGSDDDDDDDEGGALKRKLPKCVICYSEEAGVLFDPCGHLVSCFKCASGFERCFVCRQTIEKTIKVFVV